MSDKLTDIKCYAIVDGANEKELLGMLETLSPSYFCLYPEPVQPELVELAPYLIEVNEEVEKWLKTRSAPWGFYFTSRKDLKVLRKHFRRFLYVKIPVKKKPVFFRFYDPRVLWSLLSVMNPWQIHFLFKGIITIKTNYGSLQERDFSEIHAMYPAGTVFSCEEIDLDDEQYNKINQIWERSYRERLYQLAVEWKTTKKMYSDVGKNSSLYSVEELKETAQILHSLVDDLFYFCQQNEITDNRSIRSLLWLCIEKGKEDWATLPKSWLTHLQYSDGPGFYRVEKLLLNESGILPQVD